MMVFTVKWYDTIPEQIIEAKEIKLKKWLTTRTSSDSIIVTRQNF